MVQALAPIFLFLLRTRYFRYFSSFSFIFYLCLPSGPAGRPGGRPWYFSFFCPRRPWFPRNPLHLHIDSVEICENLRNLPKSRPGPVIFHFYSIPDVFIISIIFINSYLFLFGRAAPSLAPSKAWLAPTRDIFIFSVGPIFSVIFSFLIVDFIFLIFFIFFIFVEVSD